MTCESTRRVRWRPLTQTPPFRTFTCMWKCGRFDLWRLGVDFCMWQRSTSSGELELLHAWDLHQKKHKSITQNAWKVCYLSLFQTNEAIDERSSLMFLTAKNMAALSPADMRWCTPSHFVAVHQLLWSLQVVDLLRKKNIWSLIV